jgi:uncharacterized membrane protein YeaQ/YmgE (transglycosylase-associated protein family)
MLLSSMGLVHFLLLLAIAGLCGAVGQSIAGYSHGGCLASIALGFIGALLGVWLAQLMRLPEVFVVDVGRSRFPVLWSIAGSALFVGIVSAFRRR